MYRQKKHDDIPQTGYPSTIKTILKYRAIWISSVYFLAYVGTESAISGWIVSFLTRARGASTEAAALSLSGFWTGMAIGRLSLGVVTDYLGVARATTMYLSTAITLEILLAVFSSVKVSITLATVLGFIMGPLFPSGIVLLTSLLPKETHIAAVSFVASIGQIGGALLPFVIGATVQGLGIQIFKYVVVVQLSVALGIWLVILGIKGEEVVGEDLDDDEIEE
jgi:fucose permease